METKNDSESFRRLRVRQLWKARPSGERGQETGISFFSERLKEHNPELLPPGQGDAYQRLKAELLRAGDGYDSQITRLKRLTAERALGKKISFDITNTTIGFRITDPATNVELVEAKGEWFPEELADKSDNELWAMIVDLSKGKLT